MGRDNGTGGTMDEPLDEVDFRDPANPAKDSIECPHCARQVENALTGLSPRRDRSS
jgi:hypothetical protein